MVSDVRKCYPGGKPKAFSLSYDDGVEQDLRFVDLLNRYGLRGTFNLNSQLMLEGFSWVHESGVVVRRLPVEKARTLYRGHEIASHSMTHPYLHTLPESEVMRQLGEDKHQLEALFNRPVAGFALPFTDYNETIARCAQRCGFEYVRISEESGNFDPIQPRFSRRAGMFHLNPNLGRFVEEFFCTDCELALCQIVGHSYDLDLADMWQTMEKIFFSVSQNPEIVCLTNLELVRYLDAMERAVLTECEIYNPTDTQLWFRLRDRVLSVRPGERICYDDIQ